MTMGMGPYRVHEAVSLLPADPNLLAVLPLIKQTIEEAYLRIASLEKMAAEGDLFGNDFDNGHARLVELIDEQMKRLERFARPQ